LRKSGEREICTGFSCGRIALHIISPPILSLLQSLDWFYEPTHSFAMGYFLSPLRGCSKCLGSTESRTTSGEDEK
jgi:hypothetical protein